MEATINGLSAKGNTLLPLGAVWGWRLLSPNWRNKWGGTMDANALPLDYDEELMDQPMVFMTDGTNQMPSCNSSNPDATYIMTAYGTLCQGTSEAPTKARADATLDTKTASDLRGHEGSGGIVIYTIVFGASGSSASAKTLMKNCASAGDLSTTTPKSRGSGSMPLSNPSATRFPTCASVSNASVVWCEQGGGRHRPPPSHSLPQTRTL